MECLGSLKTPHLQRQTLARFSYSTWLVRWREGRMVRARARCLRHSFFSSAALSQFFSGAFYTPPIK